MTIAIRRFIYVYQPVNQQEEHYFPHTNPLRREDFIWLISKAARLHPNGYALARYVWLQNGRLETLAARFSQRPERLEQYMDKFFTALEHLSAPEEQSSHDDIKHPTSTDFA
ncbi:TPA: hypothetical protein ACN30T_004346 [Vibrio parahaemolyticus]